MPILIKDAKDGQFFSKIEIGDETLHTSETYTTKENAIKSVKSLVREIFKAFGLPAPDMAGKSFYWDQTERKKPVAKIKKAAS